MGVFRRFREETDFDILELADQLKRKTAVYIMNEKRVPKRWRYVYGIQAVQYADRIREAVTIANDIHATSEELLAERCRYQTRALSYCNLFQCQLIDMEETLDGVTSENLREIVDILDGLISRVINWRKKDRVISC